MASSLPAASVFADGVLEPLRSLFAFTISGGALAANITVRSFVDAIGQNQAGGFTLVQGDYNLSGGLIPSGIGYECEALSMAIGDSTMATVPSELLTLGLGANVWLQMNYAGQLYDLGLLQSYLGPYGMGPTNRNNVQFERRFGWPWMDVSRPLVLEPGKQFWIQAQTLRAMTGMPNGTWLIRNELPVRKVTQGVSAVKQ